MGGQPLKYETLNTKMNAAGTNVDNI